MTCTTEGCKTDLAHGVPALHPERKGQLNRSPKVNWVEKGGGLPPYINSVATALQRQGMSRSTAIATAVNTVKKACATGLWGGQKRKVSGAIQAAACAAAAQWEALKASTSIEADDRMAIELANAWERTGSLERGIFELTAKAKVIELAKPGPGLVQRTVKVTNSKGTTFDRRIWVRPEQAKALDKQAKGKGGKATVTKQGLSVTGAAGKVLTELSKIPRDQRPQGWKEAVRAIAASNHGGRLGPKARQALHALGKRSPKGSPLALAIRSALKTDVPAKPKRATRKKAQARKSRRRAAPKRKAKRKLLKFEDGSAQVREGSRIVQRIPNLKAHKKAGKKIDLASPSTAERKQAESKNQAMPGGRFPIRNRSDLSKAIKAVGRATDSNGNHSEAERAKVRRHIKRRAKALGLTSLLPDSWS